MTESVRVSVAIATRNGARFFDEQLQSILTQTRPVDELVVSDDASSDATLDILERRLSESALDVTILRNDPPLGVVGNFTNALAACTGDVILLSDQDDVWHADRVAASLAVLEDEHWLAMHSDARLIDTTGEPIGLKLLDALEVSPMDRSRIARGDAFPLFLRRNLATGATMAIRRELRDLALPVPVGWIHDEWLAIVAASLGRLTLVDRELIDYRQHGANEIGVAEPRVATKVRRVLAPRGDRNRVLAERSASLEQRLSGLDVPAELRADAASKRRFEAARAALPRTRVRRIPGVLRMLSRGEYARFASRGRADVLRDLLQPW